MPVLDFPSLHIDDEAASTLPPVVTARLTGEQDPGRLSAIAAEWLAAKDFLHVFNIMCAPDGEEAGRLHQALNLAEIYDAVDLLKDDFPTMLSGQLALALSDREDPKKIIRELALNGALAHLSAGYIVRWVVSRWLNPTTKRDASLIKAAAVIQEWCTDNRIVGGKAQNITRHIWPKYKSVSHLWAALLIMHDVGAEIRTPQGFLSFCSTAQWLFQVATTIVPIGRGPAGAPFLVPADMWTIPPPFIIRAVDRSTGADRGIATIWIRDLDAHDIRNGSLVPSAVRPKKPSVI